MKKHTAIIGVLAAGVVLLAAQNSSWAQGATGGSSMGVGAETMLIPPIVGGVGGAGEFVYDMGTFHIDGLLMFGSWENTGTLIGLGGRFYYVVHQRSAADFSVGGGLAFINFDPDGPGSSETDIVVEAGAKIRVFLAENVALHSTLGLSFYADDNGADTSNLVDIGGRLSGNLGITYFFR